MVGRPLQKIPCESFTRSSNYTVQCKCKGKLMKSGKFRCKFHGGASVGATSLEGKIKAYKNLKQFKNNSEEQLKQWIKSKLEKSSNN